MTVTAAVLLSLACADTLAAQRLPPTFSTTGLAGRALPRTSAAAAANTSQAFVLEAIGGTAGSLAGMGIVALVSECDVEDLACLLLTVGAGGGLGAVGATIGTTLVARQTGSDRSVAGALLGSVVGTGVGLGVHYLLNRGTDRNIGDKVVLPIFSLAQGISAAWGSRVIGR